MLVLGKTLALFVKYMTDMVCSELLVGMAAIKEHMQDIKDEYKSLSSLTAACRSNAGINLFKVVKAVKQAKAEVEACLPLYGLTPDQIKELWESKVVKGADTWQNALHTIALYSLAQSTWKPLTPQEDRPTAVSNMLKLVQENYKVDEAIVKEVGDLVQKEQQKLDAANASEQQE